MANILAVVLPNAVPGAKGSDDFKVGLLGIQWLLVDDDPSADTGTAAPVGSLASRDNAGTGELWFKTGEADTAWTQVTVP